MSDAEGALVQRLRGIAGVEKGDTFDLTHLGVRVRVNHVGGSSSRVSLSVRYDQVARGGAQTGYRGGALTAIRPMTIVLSPEGASHRAGKASGMDVEVQTDDPPFDDKVYVDTLTPADVAVHVLGPDVRRAVLELFAIDFASIVIDDSSGDITATIHSFASREPGVDIGMQAVDAFARLALGVPRVTKTAGEHPSHPLKTSMWLLSIGAVACLCLCPIAYFGTNPHCVDDMTFAQTAGCLGPGLLGLVPGLLAAVLAAMLGTKLSRRYAGRSDSSSVGSSFSMAAFGIVFLVITTLTGILVAHM